MFSKQGLDGWPCSLVFSLMETISESATQKQASVEDSNRPGLNKLFKLLMTVRNSIHTILTKDEQILFFYFAGILGFLEYLTLMPRVKTYLIQYSWSLGSLEISCLVILEILKMFTPAPFYPHTQLLKHSGLSLLFSQCVMSCPSAMFTWLPEY